MPNSVMNLGASSWLRIRASWMHTYGWVCTFPCHGHGPVRHMHMHAQDEWPVAWECVYPCVSVHPGCTYSQPRCCAQIHDTVLHSSQRKSYTLTQWKTWFAVCNSDKMGDTD